MKTFEFIKKTEMLGFYVVCQDDAIYVRISGLNKHWIMRIGNEYCGDIKADFNDVKWKFDFKALYELAVDYAFTPIEEREDEPRFYVAIAPGKYLMRQMGEYIISGITERNWASGFTPNTYTQTLLNQPQWGPFLPPYDADNTDVFVPVEEDNEI